MCDQRESPDPAKPISLPSAKSPLRSLPALPVINQCVAEGPRRPSSLSSATGCQGPLAESLYLLGWGERREGPLSVCLASLYLSEHPPGDKSGLRPESLSACESRSEPEREGRRFCFWSSGHTRWTQANLGFVREHSCQEAKEDNTRTSLGADFAKWWHFLSEARSLGAWSLPQGEADVQKAPAILVAFLVLSAALGHLGQQRTIQSFSLFPSHLSSFLPGKIKILMLYIFPYTWEVYSTA